MNIAIDGMGGDNAPHAVVEGALKALEEFKDINITLTGNEDVIYKELSKYNYDKNRISVEKADEVISPNEQPVKAVRKKKNSTLNRAVGLVKEGTCDAVISAGSTGAFLAASLLTLGRIKGVDRPALAPLMPGVKGNFLVLDSGANAECKPQNLLQFAVMGKNYFENVLGVTNPKIGLINIGAEEEKGNELTKAAYKLLSTSSLNFVGNVEPRDISSGNVQVLVCDGFVGNTVLKMYGGVASNIFSIIKKEIMSTFRSKLGGVLLKPVFQNIKKKFDYKEHGGAPFIGVNGICIKAHGSSDALAIKNAIRQAKKFYDNDFINKMKQEVENLNIEE
ncbi:phosphate acyltransferase PlsX [Clostridium polynesiense]|uniref:phosphate acyltransferase PlsX n=1 Tax=Clostridium polynesiense TaxID=1325933 RepID=UPI000590F9A4|nr:phosphate acyltransferase PlsX [Clostridium polynesiense]